VTQSAGFGFGGSAASIAPRTQADSKRPGNSWLFSPGGIQKLGNTLQAAVTSIRPAPPVPGTMTAFDVPAIGLRCT